MNSRSESVRAAAATKAGTTAGTHAMRKPGRASRLASGYAALRVACSVAAAGAMLATLLPACEQFDGPPITNIEGATLGVLPDVSAPLILRFSKPVMPDSLSFSIVALEVDAEGNLPDEEPEATRRDLKPLYARDPSRSADFGGVGEFIDGNTGYRLKPTGSFPVAQKLALVIEPGFKTATSLESKVRERLTFAYDFKCTGTGTKLLKSGGYFFLLQVEKPLQLEVQLFADLRVNQATGEVVGQFTNADRIDDAKRCKTLQCGGNTPYCATLPAEKCIVQSDKAGNADYFPDYFANFSPPLGFGVTVRGCASDTSATSVAFATFPATLVIASPPITVVGLTVVTPFTLDSEGVLRGTGSGQAGNALLNGGAVGEATGTVLARSLTAEQTPKDLPKAP